MDWSACLTPHPEGSVLAVAAQPRAARDDVAGMLGRELKIKIAAPPVDDAANAALTVFLAKTLKTRKSSVTLIQGRTSRHKKFLVRGMRPEEVASRLNGR